MNAKVDLVICELQDWIPRGVEILSVSFFEGVSIGGDDLILVPRH